jgi:hypothetical protein
VYVGTVTLNQYLPLTSSMFQEMGSATGYPPSTSPVLNRSTPAHFRHSFTSHAHRNGALCFSWWQHHLHAKCCWLSKGVSIFLRVWQPVDLTSRGLYVRRDPILLILDSPRAMINYQITQQQSQPIRASITKVGSFEFKSVS